jgi:predicted transcriptional regulator
MEEDATAHTGRPLPPLELSVEETEELRRLERRLTAAQALALSARMILACAEGRSKSEVARSCRVTRPTVRTW